VTIFVSWNNARKQAGLAEVRIHDLRHSFASFLVNNGRSLYEVQKILGHTQIKTTQRYAHLAQETLIDAANTVTPSLGDAFTPMVSQVSESNLLTSNPKCGKVP
jgi:site-specific recombinase XerD